MAEPYGVTIREERVRQGLSQNQLSQLSGISRRHLASLENGANVSVGILKAVTRVLGITDIDLGDGLSAHCASPEAARTHLLPFVEEVLREAERVAQIARNLRAFVKGRVGKSIRNDTPSEEAVSGEAAHLVELTLKFAGNAGTLTDRKTIRELERDVSELLNRSTTA